MAGRSWYSYIREPLMIDFVAKASEIVQCKAEGDIFPEV
jgi:hypothetical protein